MIAVEEKSRALLAGRSPGGATRRLRERDCQLVSLLDIMEEIQPDWFLAMMGALGVLQLLPKLGKRDWESLFDDEFRAEFTRVVLYCHAMGLVASEATAQKVLALLGSPKPTYEKLPGLIKELTGRLEDEARHTMFLSLSMREASEYAKPRDGWEGIIEKFPSVVRDVEEASKCFVFGRATASAFHCMRVAESGLRALGVALNDPGLDPKTNPTWGRILDRCDKELQKPRADRSAEWRTDELFFSRATANLRVVQYAWRNPTLHVDQSYTPEEAREISGAIRAFMRHLASKLSE